MAAVTSDEEGKQLSIASLATFIFYLAQFTGAGLQIIFTSDEVQLWHSSCG